MKVYYNSGNKEFNPGEFAEHLHKNGYTVGQGVITSAEIVERKCLSNKGHAVQGGIELRNGGGLGFNVGQVPTGTGAQNYIPFLEELECKKIGPLFRIESIVGKNLYLLMNRLGSNGIFTSKGLEELENWK